MFCKVYTENQKELEKCTTLNHPTQFCQDKFRIKGVELGISIIIGLAILVGSTRAKRATRL